MINFDRFTVKHVTQNIQSDCHQWLYGSVECTKFVFGRGSSPDRTGELTALPQTRSWFKGPYFEGRGWEVEGKGKGERNGRGGSQIPRSAPASIDVDGMSRHRLTPYTVQYLNITQFIHTLYTSGSNS